MKYADRFNDSFRTPPPILESFAKYFLKNKNPCTPQQADTIAQHLYTTDPLADAWVDYAYQNLDRVQAQEWVDKALTQGITQLPNAPDALQNLFHQIEQVPLWLDYDLLDLAHTTFTRSGFIGHWVLTQVALMGGYRYQGVIQPLLMTGRLKEYASKRMADTTQFITDVTSRDGLKQGNQGRAAAVQVRLLHAYIRYHLNTHKDWSHQAWGDPISQSDMVATQLLFSLSFLVTSRFMGMRYTEREAHSIIHLWRYVGYLMGLNAHLVPATEEEARQIFYRIVITQSIAGEESISLAQALHEVPLMTAKSRLQRLKAKAEMKWRAGISHIFLGEDAMQHLQLPITRTRYLVYAMIPGVFAYETVRRRVPKATQLSSKIGGAWQAWHLARIKEHKTALYQKASPHSVKPSP